MSGGLAPWEVHGSSQFLIFAVWVGQGLWHRKISMALSAWLLFSRTQIFGSASRKHHPNPSVSIPKSPWLTSGGRGAYFKRLWQVVERHLGCITGFGDTRPAFQRSVYRLRRSLEDPPWEGSFLSWTVPLRLSSPPGIQKLLSSFLSFFFLQTQSVFPTSVTFLRGLSVSYLLATHGTLLEMLSCPWEPRCGQRGKI